MLGYLLRTSGKKLERGENKFQLVQGKFTPLISPRQKWQKKERKENSTQMQDTKGCKIAA